MNTTNTPAVQRTEISLEGLTETEQALIRSLAEHFRALNRAGITEFSIEGFSFEGVTETERERLRSLADGYRAQDQAELAGSTR